MKMFESFLASIPKNRSQMVNELEVPEVTLSPYVWTEPDESLSIRSDSILSGSTEEYEVGTLSTDSSIPLSRAMTDSEIDYSRYKRYKSRSFSDPWDQMKAALDAFPPGYLASLNSFQNSSTELTEASDSPIHRPLYSEELRLKMERFFEDECRVFTLDDPGLLALEEALDNIDIKKLESDLEKIVP